MKFVSKNHKPEIFWEKVDVRNTDECWNWKKCVNSTGRGMYSIGHKNIKAHRMAWILTYGEIPDGLFVCHRCDNPICCNPNHLFLGTHLDNMRDMCEKGRKVTLRGEKDPKSKLTEKDVEEIRGIFSQENHPSQKKIAEKYGVSRSTIEAVVCKYNWKHMD